MGIQYRFSQIYVIPKKKCNVGWFMKWADTMEEFVNDSMTYLRQYYLRNNSESGFSADKRWFGWKAGQKKDDRFGIALIFTDVWNSLMNCTPVNFVPQPCCLVVWLWDKIVK
jgi:transposase